MSHRRRAALVLGVLVALLVMLGVAGTPSAHAQEAPEEGCPANAIGLPCDPGWGAVGGAIADPVQEAAEDALCPKKPPTVRSPSMDVPWADTGGKTQFQKYGYAGLQITTHEQGCIAQIKAGGASGVNEAILAVDELINSAQVAAVGDATTSNIERVMPAALTALKDTFWTPWMPVAATAAGVLVLLYGMASHSSAVVTVAGNVILLLGFVPWLLGNPQTIIGLSNDMTVGAAEQTADGLLSLHPSSAGSSAAAAYGDAYYSLAWSSHVQQSFGGHEKCAGEFAAQFVPTKAFSYDEQARINAGDTALETRLVKEKGEKWNALADEMKDKYPGCYETWANPEGAWGPVMKHGSVTTFAGGWVGLFSLAILALKYLLLFGLVVLAGLSIAAFVQRKLTAAFAGLLVAGVFGPPLMSLGSGSMLFMFYVIISDPQTAWWSAIVSGVGLGLGALLALSYLGPALLGFAAVGMARRGGRKGRRSTRRGSTARAAAVGAAAGAATSGGHGSGSGSRVPVDGRSDPVGFHAPTDPDARFDPPPADPHPSEGGEIPAWWHEPSPRTVDPSGSGVGQQTEGMAQDWSQFSEPNDGVDDDSGIVTRWSPADVPTAQEEPTMTETDYRPGVTHQRMPEPSTGDRDLVKSTFAAYGGRSQPPISADDFGPPPPPIGGVDGA